uniref:Uncharacterized protein n=1 Tax=Anguilla anguilla TaxID=7936 RepID=A0A0E9RC73_ANGAN
MQNVAGKKTLPTIPWVLWYFCHFSPALVLPSLINLPLAVKDRWPVCSRYVA